MLKYLRYTLVCLFILPGLIQAQNVSKVGTTAAKFLGVPIGARATSMGAAFVSQADDATATYWNPGALSRLQQTELCISHSEWFGGLDFNFGSLVYPLGAQGSDGAIGISYTALSMPEERITTVDDPEGLDSGTFDAGSYSIGVSFAKSLTDRFSIGGTAKYIVENIYNSKASGLAIDIGTLYNTPFQGIRLGVCITNFGQKMQIEGEDLIVQKDIDATMAGNNESVNAMLLTDKFDLPLLMRIGISWDVINSAANRLTLIADAMHPNDNTESLSLGSEYSFLNESFFLRGGYKNLFLENNEGRFTAGFGVKIKSQFTTVKFDYAFSEFRHLQDVHVVSMSLVF